MSSRLLGRRVSLGQGQPVFYTKDISHIDKRTSSHEIIGYSITQKQYISLFKGDSSSDLDIIMQKIVELLDVKYV